MILRPASPADAPVCAAIVRAWIEASPWMPGGPSEAELIGILERGFAPGSGREAWVAEQRTPLGYLSLDPEEGHIHGLYVGPRGRGTGKALLDRVKTGRGFLQLNSHAPNAAAHRFYEREGFRVAARNLPGSDGVPEIRMEWQL